MRTPGRAIASGKQRVRTDERHLGAERAQTDDVRARDAAVQDVADERDAQTLDLAELRLQREQVEQRLRRVRVAAVARVDDVAVERFCER
jgi:hypothetical protein